MQYMTRCAFSLLRLIKVTETGQVVYKVEKDACRAFPDPQRNDLATGPKRNFHILSPSGIPSRAYPACSTERVALDPLTNMH